MSWMDAVSIEELESRKRAIVRQGAKQIAVWQMNGRILAADNRCPHQGYPLSEGSLNPENCVLTCNWHNWKFQLEDGENLNGEDRLQVYRTKLEKGRVWIEIPEISREEKETRIVQQFEQAFGDQSYDRMARELARLYFNGSDPSRLIRRALEWSYDRFEYGMTHAYAVLADWLTLYHEFEAGDQKLVCLLEALDYLSEDSLRQPVYSYTAARVPFSEAAFLQAVENEDEEQAVAMILNAIEAQGMHFADVERALSHAALRHYQDFGHSLIYVHKARQVVQHLGAESERFVLPALVRSIVTAYREDLIPEFRTLQRHVDAWSSGSANAAIDPQELYGRTQEFAMQWTVRQSALCSPEALYDALLQAGARHLLHYDIRLQTRFDLPVSKNIGWLDFTHAITFANAVRAQCRKFPELWKHGLLQMACFAGRNGGFLDKDAEIETKWIVSDEQKFYQDCLELLVDHGQGLPIYAAHLVKTFVAARTEAAHAASSTRRFVLAATNRFLHSPIRQKHARRTARQALELVGRDYREQ